MTMTAVERPIFGESEVEEISRHFAHLKALFDKASRNDIVEIAAVAEGLGKIVQHHKGFIGDHKHLRILIVINQYLNAFVASPCEMFAARIDEAIDRSIMYMAAYLSMAGTNSILTRKEVGT